MRVAVGLFGLLVSSGCATMIGANISAQSSSERKPIGPPATADDVAACERQRAERERARDLMGDNQPSITCPAVGEQRMSEEGSNTAVLIGIVVDVALFAIASQSFDYER